MFYLYAAVVLIMSVTAFILMRTDKLRARHRERRIPERVLFLAAAFFGAAGGCLGMYFYHHKTKHLKFALGFPLLFLLQVYVTLLLIGKRIIRLPF
ncbi:MAG: DUF1294 domain-containing protein [Oscillospiraceae bacterium]|nr:DUF1294 domain-containing protein [Oscillospiraceae bacterium]